MVRKYEKTGSRAQPSIRINTVISGEPAEWLLDWKLRGIVRSNSDAIRQAFRAFREKLVSEDLRAKQSR